MPLSCVVRCAPLIDIVYVVVKYPSRAVSALRCVLGCCSDHRPRGFQARCERSGAVLQALLEGLCLFLLFCSCSSADSVILVVVMPVATCCAGLLVAAFDFQLLACRAGYIYIVCIAVLDKEVLEAPAAA